MSDASPVIDDPQLGEFARATSELTDGTVLTHDWYAHTYVTDAGEIELMLEGTEPDAARALLPRIHATVDGLYALVRMATDAIVTRFSTGEPPTHELDEAADDLALEAIEATAEGIVVLHFVDSCGEHFPEGYWPAAHVDDTGAVIDVTVES